MMWLDIPLGAVLILPFLIVLLLLAIAGIVYPAIKLTRRPLRSELQLSRNEFIEELRNGRK